MEHLSEARLNFPGFFNSSNEQMAFEFDSETKYMNKATREYASQEISSRMTNTVDQILNKYVKKARLRIYVIR